MHWGSGADWHKPKKQVRSPQSEVAMLRGRLGLVWMLIGWIALVGLILLAIGVGAWVARTL
jgi:hypothetical protein